MIAGVGAYGAVKLSKRDAQRIQDHTGLPPEQLEDKDLQRSMHELNIHPQQMSEEEKMSIESGKQPHQPSSHSHHPSTHVTRTHVSNDSTQSVAAIQKQLEILSQMKKDDLITKDDYDAKKKQLLRI